MSIMLIWVYIIVNIYIAIKHYRNHLGVFELPFLVSMISMIFIVPNLFVVHSYYENNADSFMSYSLIIFILCNYAFHWGFVKAAQKKEQKYYQEHFNISKGKYVISIFAIIGLWATLKNKGEYQGGFAEGAYVIINFFTIYLPIAMNMVFVCIYKKYKIPFFFYIILFAAIFLQIEQFVTIARRAQAMQTCLTCSFFYFLTHDTNKYRKYKFIIPCIFIIGFFLNSQVASYRSNAYSNEISVMDNIKSISFSNTELENNLDLFGNEINNAIIGINDIKENLSFDYGTFNINVIVQRFVPKILVGADVKSLLMIKIGGSEKAKYLGSTGSTMTGYYDAYSSFGLLGWIKFLLLGYLMGYFWRKRETSVNYLLLYACMFSPVMEIISHDTNYPISQLIFYYVFALPLIKMTFIKIKK